MVCNVFVIKNKQLEEKWSGRPKTLSTADEQYQKVVLKKYGEKIQQWPDASTVHQCPIRPGLSGGVPLGHCSVEHIHLWKHSFQAIWWQNLLRCHCISQHPLMRNSEGKISPIQETLGTRLHMHKLESSDIHWVWQHPPGRTPDLFTQNLLLVYKSKLFLYYYKEIFCEICKKSSAAHTKS